MSRAIIRDARIEDAGALCEAERAVARATDGALLSYPTELCEAAFRERITAHLAGSAKVLVAQIDDDPVGHASLWPMPLRKNAHVLRLDLCVHVGHWREGHGRALLEALLRWADTKPDVHKIELLVRAENRPAIALYEKAGFTIEGRLKDRVRLSSGRFVDDLSMARFKSSGFTMRERTRSAFESKASAYQRNLMRRMLVPLAVFIALDAVIVLAYFAVGDRWRSPMKAIVGMILVVLAAQVPMAALRRHVSEASAACGFTCPSCGKPLGLRYATIRRNGKCVNCGTQLFGDP